MAGTGLLILLAATLVPGLAVMNTSDADQFAEGSPAQAEYNTSLTTENANSSLIENGTDSEEPDVTVVSVLYTFMGSTSHPESSTPTAQTTSEEQTTTAQPTPGEPKTPSSVTTKSPGGGAESIVAVPVTLVATCVFLVFSYIN